MKFWKTYVMVALAAGLAAYAYFVESKRSDTADGPAKDKAVVFETAQARELRITPKQGETMKVVKEGDGWKLVEPLQAAADQQQVDSLLSILQRTEIEDVVDAPKDLNEFGLDPPEFTIELMVEGGKEPLRLLLGNRVAGGFNVYAKRPEETRLVVVSNNLRSAYETKPTELRDRDILHVKAADVSRLDITGPEGSYTLERRGEEWWVTAPLETMTNRWRVDNLLSSLEHIRMERVAEENAADLKPFGLVKPLRTVSLTLKGGGTKRLEVGKLASAPPKADGAESHGGAASRFHFAREASSSMVTVIPNTVVSDLELGLAGMRAGRLLDVSVFDVTGVEVETADGKKQVYTRSTSKDHAGTDQFNWKRTAPDAKDLEANVMQDLLSKVGGVESQSFIDNPAALEAYGLKPAALKVTLSFEGRPSIWFELGEKDGAVYGRRPNDAAVLKLGEGGQDLLTRFKSL